MTHAPLDGQLRKGEHSDWGTLTILYEDGTGGLQIRGPDGNWFDAPHVENGFIVNIGDLMSIWTNNEWVSTKHRVLLPPADRADEARISIAFFHTPNWDAEISCLPSCSSAADPPRYPPTTAGRYLEQKLHSTRQPGSN